MRGRLSGTCIALCKGESDCAAGLKCSSAGQCEAPATVAQPHCGCVVPGVASGGEGAGAALGVVLGALGLARRRRGRTAAGPRAAHP